MADDQPASFGFVWDREAWERIAFSEIPNAIFDTNMLIESIPSTTADLVTLERKNGSEENGARTKPPCLHQIDKSFRLSAH